MKRKLFVLDLDRCTGCAACVIACKTENQVSDGLNWRQIYTFNHQRLPLAPVYHFSLSCNHCYDPACLTNCPANAYSREGTTGAVLINQKQCMGCRYCSWVCPYNAPQFNPNAGVMEKCTFCVDLQADGNAPACVVACPVDALQFESEGKTEIDGRPGFPDTGLSPSIKFLGSRRQASPKMTAAPAPISARRHGQIISWQGLRTEWPLWVFTSIATLLVAWFTVEVIAGQNLNTIELAIFVFFGVFSMAISALHLGQVSKIYRAPLNFKGSWISREVVFFAVFFASACGVAFQSNPPVPLLLVIVVVGFSALFSMDMVYRIPGQIGSAVPHSAMTSLGAAYYIGLALSLPSIAIPSALLKCALYCLRIRKHTAGSPLTGLSRIGVGLVAPCLFIFLQGLPSVVFLAAAVIGELIDRAEFYAGLRFLNPARQISQDLEYSA